MATRAAKLALRGKALSDTGTEIGIVNNADATAITIDSNENVGIGTTNPVKFLDVGINSNATAIDANIRLNTHYGTLNTARGGIQMHDGGNVTGQIDTRYNGSRVDMHFGSLYNGDYNSTSRMVITGAGNVGIGIASPTAKLHIEAPDNTDLMRFTVTGNEMWAFKGASAAGSNDTVSFGIAGGTQAMAWDESGRVTKPLQPSFHARLNAAWTHPSGTVLVLGTWAVSTNENIGSCYDTSTRRFTAPVSGTYAFNCIVATGGGTGTFSYLSAELWVNGSRRRVGHWGGGGYSYGGTSGSYIAYLSAGDYAQLGCEANKTFSVQSGNSSHTQFSGHLLG